MKADINISKKMTINTGNYSSIQPSVSITLKDVDMENYNECMNNLSVILDTLFTVNLMEHAEYQQVIKDHGLNKVLNSINQEKMKIETEKAIKKLCI